MDGSIERLMDQLEAKFDALLACEEEAAADDLATSLDRGISLHERLLAGRQALTAIFPEGARCSVTEIGPEHLGCGSPVNLITRIGATVTAQEVGLPPKTSDLTLVQALRPWAEAGRRVEVRSAEGTASYAGCLVLVGSDHLILERAGTRLVIPLETVGSIRLSREG